MRLEPSFPMWATVTLSLFFSSLPRLEGQALSPEDGILSRGLKGNRALETPRSFSAFPPFSRPFFPFFSQGTPPPLSRKNVDMTRSESMGEMDLSV